MVFHLQMHASANNSVDMKMNLEHEGMESYLAINTR